MSINNIRYAVLLMILIHTSTQTGWASHYGNGGVMQSTIAARQRMGHIPQTLPTVDGYAAVKYPNQIGDVIWVRPINSYWSSVLIVDCAGIQDGGLDWMLRNNILLEVDYRLASQWGNAGRGTRVEVSLYKPTYTISRTHLLEVNQ